MTSIGSPAGVAALAAVVAVAAAAVVAAAAAVAGDELDAAVFVELPHAARVSAMAVIATTVTLRTRRPDDAFMVLLT
jgi:hypothetical protein